MSKPTPSGGTTVERVLIAKPFRIQSSADSTMDRQHLTKKKEVIAAKGAKGAKGRKSKPDANPKSPKAAKAAQGQRLAGCQVQCDTCQQWFMSKMSESEAVRALAIQAADRLLLVQVHSPPSELWDVVRRRQSCRPGTAASAAWARSPSPRLPTGRPPSPCRPLRPRAMPAAGSMMAR